MSFTKKQKKIGLIILVFAYIYFFYSYNINDSIPAIFENRTNLAEAKEELEKLEVELANISVKEGQLKNLETANDRYSDFIANNINMEDVINYMERFESIFAGKISAVNISSPRRLSNSDQEYFEVMIGMRANLKYKELLALVNYVEGGTRLSKITRLQVMPEPFTPQQKQLFGDRLPSIYREDWNLIVNLSLILYAISEEDAEMLYEVSKNKFEKFGYYDGIAFVLPSLEGGGTVTSIITGGVSTKPLPPITERRDFTVFLGSYLTGIENFTVRDTLSGKGKGFSKRIRERQEVTLRMNDYVYSMEVRDLSGKVNSITGNFPQRDLGVFITDFVPDIQENINIGMDFRIINDSSYQIGVNINKKSKRVKILDRNFQEVISKSVADKIFLI